MEAVQPPRNQRIQEGLVIVANQIFEKHMNGPNLTIFFETPEQMASFVDAMVDGDIRAGEPIFARNVDETFFNRMVYSLPRGMPDESIPIPVYTEE